MLRPASWVLARTLPRLDPPVMRLSKNRHSLTSLLSGLPLVTLTTRGAQSGLARRVPLIPQVDGEKLIFIASNFGQRHNPGWHYNLLAHPQAQVTRAGATKSYLARQAQGEERERYWGMAVRSYPGYAAYARRASHRAVGVWVLEPESFTTEFTESTEIRERRVFKLVLMTVSVPPFTKGGRGAQPVAQPNLRADWKIFINFQQLSLTQSQFKNSLSFLSLV